MKKIVAFLIVFLAMLIFAGVLREVIGNFWVRAIVTGLVGAILLDCIPQGGNNV